MITQKGTLPVGIEVDGEFHCDFELRPQLVRDSILAAENERAQSNSSYLGLLMLANQVMSLGSLPKEKITAELLLDALDVDMQALVGGAAQLRERLKTFRADCQKPA